MVHRAEIQHGIVYQLCCCLVSKSCPTLWEPRDWSPPGSFVHGISHARILEWVVMPSSRGSAWSRDWTWVSFTGRWILYHWAIRDACINYTSIKLKKQNKTQSPHNNPPEEPPCAALVGKNFLSNLQASFNQEAKLFILLTLMTLDFKYSSCLIQRGSGESAGPLH